MISNDPINYSDLKKSGYHVYNNLDSPVTTLYKMTEEFKTMYMGNSEKATALMIMKAYNSGFFDKWIIMASLPAELKVKKDGKGGEATNYGRYGLALEQILGVSQNSRPGMDIEGEAELKTNFENLNKIHLFMMNPFYAEVTEFNEDGSIMEIKKLNRPEDIQYAVKEIIQQQNKEAKFEIKKHSHTLRGTSVMPSLQDFTNGEYYHESTRTYAQANLVTDESNGMVHIMTQFFHVVSDLNYNKIKETLYKTIDMLYPYKKTEESMEESLGNRINEKLNSLIHFDVQRLIVKNPMATRLKDDGPEAYRQYFFRFTNMKYASFGDKGPGYMVEHFCKLINSQRITIEYSIGPQGVETHFLMSKKAINQLYGVRKIKVDIDHVETEVEIANQSDSLTN